MSQSSVNSYSFSSPQLDPPSNLRHITSIHFSLLNAPSLSSLIPYIFIQPTRNPDQLQLPNSRSDLRTGPTQLSQPHFHIQSHNHRQLTDGSEKHPHPISSAHSIHIPTSSTIEFIFAHKFTCLYSRIQHRWFSGRIGRCHRLDPGSIPGRCSHLLFAFLILHLFHFFIVCVKL